MRIATFILLGIVSAIVPAFAQTDIEAGRRSYEVCAGCHGFVGEGNATVGAPRLAGIEGWYLERQIENFRQGRRGHVEGDANGRRMALMAQAVGSERELGDLVAWITSLPATESSPEISTATANTARGQSLYAICSACHGANGRGNQALGGPSLVTLDDWYFEEQLRLFVDGMRGTHPADSYGAQMRAIATGFDTEEERQALADFIRTLR
jgi:cytochrome c oxidase subunit 2